MCYTYEEFKYVKSGSLAIAAHPGGTDLEHGECREQIVVTASFMKNPDSSSRYLW
jgi:hypothetical protein